MIVPEKMGKIVLIVIALAVLAAGGAGGYFYFGNKAVAASGHDPHASAGHDAPGEEHLQFVELDPLILPIIDQNGAHEIVSLVVAIEVHDSDGAARVTHLAPRLNDAYIQDLYGMLSHHAMREGGVVAVGSIKKRLNELTTRVLGEGVANDVLLQVVQQRPI